MAVHSLPDSVDTKNPQNWTLSDGCLSRNVLICASEDELHSSRRLALALKVRAALMRRRLISMMPRPEPTRPN